MFSLQTIIIVYCLIGFVCMLFLYPYIVDTYTSIIEENVYTSRDSNKYNNQKLDKFSTQNVIRYSVVPIIFALIWPLMLAYVLALRV